MRHSAADLRAGWTEASIGDLVEDQVEHRAPKTSARYIEISGIDRVRKQIVETTPVDSSSAPTRARQWVVAGDILVSLTRPNLNAVAMVPVELDGAVASTGFDVLRSAGVAPGWLFQRVRSHAFVEDVCKGLQGVVYPAIRPRDVRAHRLPIPPLAEQRRIVAALDSYFSRLDEAEAGLERVQRNLKRYRASVLQAAVSGRLVPTEAELARAEGRTYEPASELLARILTERRRKWAESGKRGKYKEPTPLDLSNLPDLPEGWCWATLGQCATRITKGTTPTTLGHKYTDSGIRFVRVENLSGGRVNHQSQMQYISSEADKALARSRLLQGDVLFSIAGTIGKVAVVEVNDLPANTNQAVAILRGTSSVFEPQFLLAVLASGYGQVTAASRARGGAMNNISLADLTETAVPLPPLAEQRTIAAECSARLSEAEAIERNILTASQRTRSLRQSILKWAFEGKLVDQDPGDEPAAVLLERIRAERAARRGEGTRPARLGGRSK